ncbi:MAG TPA: hypothetical protein DCG54_09610 [Anaerolineae bacterium]|jgi:hypothetical protein|nr:hypothetical protein [Anaerolineae bacterium]
MARYVSVLLVILLGIGLAACGDASNWTTAYPAASLSYSATPDVYDLALGNVQAQATLEAINGTSQAISAGLTATEYAPTRAAAETATEQAWMLQVWTATAASQQTAASSGQTATAQWWTPTPSQTPTPNYTGTVESAAAAAQATALYGEAVSVELAIERDRMMNQVQAIAPLIALVAVLVVVLVMAWRWSQVRPIQRDARGDAPLLVIDGSIYDADRNPHPLLDMSGKRPAIPALTDAALQAATTARDQLVDLATRGQPGPGRPPRKALADQMAQQSQIAPSSEIRVLSPEQARPLLGDVIPGIVRDAIETDLQGHQEVVDDG